MELSQLVCSLENARKLKELGISQQSKFYWIKKDDPYIWYNSCNYPMFVEKFYFSAFTAQELLSMLSAYLRISTDCDSNISVYYQPENGTDNSYSFEGNNLADLLAQVLIAQINEGEFKNE